MFLVVPKHKLMLIGTISFIAFGALGFIVSKSMIGVIIGSVFGMFVPSFLVKKMQDIRNNKFASQLVDGLMFLSASLKAGLSLLQALESLVEEMPAPISQEFGLVVKENRMGVALEDCFLHLRERMDNRDLHMVITAILVARETGGDLIDTFSQIVFTIREKTKIEGRVKTLCVQAKLQGIIMGILPIAFGLFIYKVNPANFEVLVKDKIGQMLLIYAVISEIIGVFLIAKFSKIKF
jgi:tight adherence protein B